MEILKAGMLSLGCGNCKMCPYRAKCNEYSDYMKFVRRAGKGAKTDERA